MIQFSNRLNLIFVFNPRNIYNQLGQLMIKFFSDQGRQCSGTSLMLMPPCRQPRSSLSQFSVKDVSLGTYIKGSWRRQKYRRIGLATCCLQRLVHEHHFSRLYPEYLWYTFYVKQSLVHNFFPLVLFFRLQNLLFDGPVRQQQDGPVCILFWFEKIRFYWI